MSTSKDLTMKIKEALVIHPSADNLFVHDQWPKEKFTDELPDDKLQSYINSLSDDEFINFANEYLGGVYIEGDEEDDDDSELGFGILDDDDVDAKMKKEIVTSVPNPTVTEGQVKNIRHPGEIHLSHGTVIKGPRFRTHLTGADKYKAASRFRKLRRSGDFKAKQQRALRRLRKSPRFKTFMQRIYNRAT